MRKISFFKSVKSQQGQLLTPEKFWDMAESESVKSLIDEIRSITFSENPDKDKVSSLKQKLPVITWQAYFEEKRVAKEAQPNGLFMVDVDHVDNPLDLHSKTQSRAINEGCVLIHLTPSGKGLRYVCRCYSDLKTIQQCQERFAENVGLDIDKVCKDFARCSFMVDDKSILYFDGRMFNEDVPPETVYAIEDEGQYVMPEPKIDFDQREGLFGGQSEYRGIPLEEIAKEWLERNGGEPHEGERNAKLYKLALRMRYLTDFNAATMLRVMPRYGLKVEEMKQLIASALSTNRAADMPFDMKDVLDRIERRRDLNDEQFELPPIITSTAVLPPLPPVFKEFVEIAPDDFKAATIMCQLPILGALGSKLRAEYLDGVKQSPSFMVSLEAPQASGKSFMMRIAEYELAEMIRHDEEERKKEREYDNKVKEMKLLNVKVTAENKDEILGSRPDTMIRYVPPTMSVTKLLIRMNAAKGLHLFAIAPEIDTVYKAFRRGAFSSYSDLLRVGFDNERYGQDYASENSFSGNVQIYYNFLNSGTPKAMRRFYPDVEDGLVSRVCFVTLPDQFGKKMPEWKKFDRTQKQIVDTGLVRLGDVSIQGDEVQEEHVMKINFLNQGLQKWIIAQQTEAVKEDDRTRDIFCRRAAVVGFRAGMLAWFLYGEKNTPTIRKKTIQFAEWVANSMLNQHLLRFNVMQSSSNTNKWANVLEELKDEFTREELEDSLKRNNYNTPVKHVLSNWRLLGVIEESATGRNKYGHKTSIKFKKIHHDSKN